MSDTLSPADQEYSVADLVAERKKHTRSRMPDVPTPSAKTLSSTGFFCPICRTPVNVSRVDMGVQVEHAPYKNWSSCTITDAAMQEIDANAAFAAWFDRVHQMPQLRAYLEKQG